MHHDIYFSTAKMAPHKLNLNELLIQFAKYEETSMLSWAKDLNWIRLIDLLRTVRIQKSANYQGMHREIGFLETLSKLSNSESFQLTNFHQTLRCKASWESWWMWRKCTNNLSKIIVRRLAYKWWPEGTLLALAIEFPTDRKHTMQWFLESKRPYRTWLPNF